MEDLGKNRVSGEDEEIRFGHTKLMVPIRYQVEILSKMCKKNIYKSRGREGSHLEIHIRELLEDRQYLK